MISDLIIFTPMYVALFWTIVLLTSKRSTNLAKFFLGIFMIAAFFVYLAHAVYFKNHNDLFIYFDPLYIFASLAVYPLYFWYIKLLTLETRIHVRNIKLLIPALFFGLATMLIYLFMSPAERINYVDGFLFKNPVDASDSGLITAQKIVFFLSRLTFTIQVLFFSIAGFRLVKKYNSQVANFYSNLENKTIVWVNLLLVSLLITSLMSIIFNLIGRNVFFGSNCLLVIPSVIFSVLLFLIGLLGSKQNYSVADFVIDKQSYPGKDLKEYNQEQILKNLLLLFEEERVFLRTDLKISHVAIMLNTNRTYISNLINREFSCSFSEFVNRYRVDKACSMLNNREHYHLSLELISEKAGFGSLGSFIRVFKEFKGTTPGKYRLKNL